MRDFLFSIWAKVGETAAATSAALKTLAAKQYTTAEQGGRMVVSASVQGKSFSYELPPGQSGVEFLSTVRESWRMVEIGGASGTQMTDAELRAYLLDADGQITSRTVASFSRYVC